MITLFALIFFTALVAVGTWLMTRKTENQSQDGFFLAGRSLTYPIIAGSLLLTNLSTEQMVGLNGSAFKDGLSVMAWEVVAVVALVLMALFFLPRFLKSGITTVPEYLAKRFDKTTELICNLIFLIAYMVVLMPIILYTGAQGMIGMLDVAAVFGDPAWLHDPSAELLFVIVIVAAIGSAYALVGGLRSCAVSDTLNGIGLLIGGLLVSYFALQSLGTDNSITSGIAELRQISAANGNRLNSIGANDAEAPFFALFTGILMIHTFYWCTNQQIIQRTLGAKNLAEGQKGVLLTGFLKLLGPLFLVLPGLIGAALYIRGELAIPLKPVNGEWIPDTAQVYGILVRNTLHHPLMLGFFAAVLLGAILSSFNSVLNSTCTLFCLGIYKPYVNRQASDRRVVVVGQIFGFVVTIVSIVFATQLAKTSSIFDFLQTMNAIYCIPILSVVAVGLLAKRTPAISASISMIAGVVLIGAGIFLPAFADTVNRIGQYHYAFLVMAALIVFQLAMGKIAPRKEPYEEKDAKVVDLTPWKYAKAVALALLVIVAIIYASFADFSVFRTGKPGYPVSPNTTRQAR
ncbi:MAG: solute:sodium symporter family transporter [Victivallaceae bacterium]|nr:solute:sodium symporter family transporter [Victivallaceae bacterium]